MTASDYQQALDDLRKAIWTDIAENNRPQHIERKGLQRALEIIDQLALRRKAQPRRKLIWKERA